MPRDRFTEEFKRDVVAQAADRGCAVIRDENAIIELIPIMTLIKGLWLEYGDDDVETGPDSEDIMKV